MPNRILFFVRHGQYRSTTLPEDEPDGPLTETGQEQARLTAQRLREYPVAVIHHSNMQRAEETANIIGASLPTVPLRPSSLLRECIPCVPPGFESHFAHIPPQFVQKGERQAQEAFAAYVKPLADEESDRYEIIVSHGNLINYLACRAVNAPKEAWINFDIQQCGLTEIIVHANGWIKLTRHNDAGHLPLSLQKFT